jgi:DNA polymerase-1
MTQDAFGYGKTLNPNGHREGVQELAPETTKPGITLQQYADYVRLPQHYLRGELNLREMSHNGYPAVKIGYPDAEGKEPYYRLRLSLKGDPRFHSPPAYLGLRPIPYGLHVMGLAREMGYAILVEGESDTQVLWYNDFPALGIPGVQAWKSFGSEWATFLNGIPALLVPVEADHGGERLWQLLRGTPSIANRLYRVPITTGGYKDVGALWKAAAAEGEEQKFRALMDAQVWVAKTYLKKATTKTKDSKRRLILPTVSLKEVTKESRENEDYFAYPLFKKGELTLLVGEAKFSGKTTLMFIALKAVLEGRTFLDMETKRAKILYLSEQGNNLSRAIETSGINVEDEDSLRVVQFRDVWTIPWSDTIDRAILTAQEQKREILPVDTFAAFSRLKGSEENNAGDVQERLEPLKIAAQAHDLAVVLVHHSGRDSMIRGSSALDGTVDTIVHLGRPPGSSQNENTRHIRATGRCEPLSLNIELKDGIYVPVGTSAQITFNKTKAAVKKVLPTTAKDALVTDTIHDRVKGEGVEASRTTLDDVIQWMRERHVLVREGEGKRGDPYRYWMPEEDFMVPKEYGDKVEKARNKNIELVSPETPGNPSEVSGRNEKPPFTYVDNTEALDEAVAAVATTDGLVALDTETSSLVVNEARIRLVQVKTAGGPTYLVDLNKVSPEAILHALADKHLLAHNSVYDLAVLQARYGYEHRGPVSDTMLMFQVFYGGTNKKASLQDALKTMLGVEVSKTEQVSDWFGDLTPKMLAYAAADVAHLHDLREALLAKVEEKARHLYPVIDLEHRMAKVTAHMSAAGMPVDKDVFAECVRESLEAAEGKLAELDALVTTEVPEEYVQRNTKSKTVPEERNGKVNWNSPEQVLWAFREVAGVEIKNTNKEVLPEVDHPMAVALMEYRKALDVYKRFRETQVVDGRVYAKWNQLKAKTGRMSCEKPPLQGIPEPLRRAFVAPKGKKLIVSDLSQIEIRVLATLCGDENLGADLEAGRDVHQRVAANVFGKAFEAVIKTERKLAKALVFGTLYGLGLSGFTARVNAMTGSHYTQVQVQEKFRGPLFAPYPKVQEWVDKVATEYDDRRGDRKTVSYTRLGRRRLQVPDVPAALNTPIQAGATDVMKAIAVAVYEGLRPEWEIVGIVHDEILLVVPEGEAPEARAWLHEVMVRAGGQIVNQGVPENRRVAVDAGTEICDTWAEKG